MPGFAGKKSRGDPCSEPRELRGTRPRRGYLVFFDGLDDLDNLAGDLENHKLVLVYPHDQPDECRGEQDQNRCFYHFN